MKHYLKLASLLLISGVLGACGGGGGSETSKPAAAASPDSAAPAFSLPSDATIAARVYDPFYSVPDGFFVDDRAGSSNSYTIHHVMNSSGAYELCTDDFHVAEALEAADNDSRAVRGYFVGSVETERYFEFIRELSYTDDVGNTAAPTSPGYARVFKCSNTSRDGVDRTELNGFAGMLNLAPRRADDVRIFAEYLWQFTFFPYRHRKVIDSVGSESAETLDRKLLLAFAVNQGTDRCDRIDVVDWTFSANRSTGRVEQQFDVIHSFEAQVVAGSPELCAS